LDIPPTSELKEDFPCLYFVLGAEDFARLEWARVSVFDDLAPAHDDEP